VNLCSFNFLLFDTVSHALCGRSMMGMLQVMGAVNWRSLWSRDLCQLFMAMQFLTLILDVASSVLTQF